MQCTQNKTSLWKMFDWSGFRQGVTAHVPSSNPDRTLYTWPAAKFGSHEKQKQFFRLSGRENYTV